MFSPYSPPPSPRRFDHRQRREYESYGYPEIDDVEDLDQYRPGGLHPILIGDFLDDFQRYKVEHKLGHGSFGTVWLCFDYWIHEWKAVKVLAADSSHEVEASEMAILKHFASVSDQELEKHHISLPEVRFFIDGPNGRHLCCVAPVFGESLYRIWRDYGHDREFLRRVCFQITEAMAFMHSRGVCHGDLRPDNILFKLKGVKDASWEKIWAMIPDPAQIKVSPIPNAFYPEGPGPHVPEYVYRSQPLVPPPEFLTGDIVICDIGEAYHVDEHVDFTGIPLKYASPETVFGGQRLGFGADVWTLGATICEIVREALPFGGDSKLDYTKHLEMLLGPLPEPYRSHLMIQHRNSEGGPHSAKEIPLEQPVSMKEAKFVAAREERIEKHGYPTWLEIRIREGGGYLQRMQPGESEDTFAPWESSFGNGYKRIQFQTPPEEADQILDLLFKIFKYRPEDRLSAEEVLAHPWFAALRGNDAEEGEHGVDSTVVTGDASELPMDEAEEESSGDEESCVNEVAVKDSEEGPEVAEPAQDRLIEWLIWVVTVTFLRLYEAALSLGGHHIYF